MRSPINTQSCTDQVKEYILLSLVQRWKELKQSFYLGSKEIQSSRGSSLRVIAHWNILSRCWCIFNCGGWEASFDLLHLELETCPDRCFTALSIWASKCRWHPYCFHFLSQPINNTWQLGQKHMLFSLIVTFWLIRTPRVIIQPWECDLVVFWNYDCSTEWNNP